MFQNTALHLAVRGNHAATVTKLMGLGCLLLENNHEYLPIDIALQYKLVESALAMVTDPLRGSVGVHLKRDIKLRIKRDDNCFNTLAEFYISHVVPHYGRSCILTTSSKIHGCVCTSLIRNMPKLCY